MQWDEASVRALTAAPDAPRAIQALILANVPGADESAGVCSYAFADLDGGGFYHLVASVDRSGRDFCNLVVVLARTPKGINAQTIETWRADEVADVIVSLDKRAGHQLAVPAALSNYESGPDCVASWPVVYALRGGELVDASRNYLDFYRRQLAEKTQALGTAGVDYPCRLMEVDKLKRFLAIAPNAGLATARTWIHSPDLGLRAKAARIFADIDNSGR
jgi:hypothetical protein